MGIHAGLPEPGHGGFQLVNRTPQAPFFVLDGQPVWRRPSAVLAPRKIPSKSFQGHLPAPQVACIICPAKGGVWLPMSFGSTLNRRLK